MGLDMYLSARLYTSKYSEEAANKELQPLADKLLPPGADNLGTISIEREVAYWRKANAIHDWFVNNVQDGKDDCGHYSLDIDKLRELYDICIKVRDASTLKKAKITNGYTITPGGGKKPILEDGETIADPSVAKELLPTKGGFFFGSTDYDQWYLEDVKQTIEMLGKIFEWYEEHKVEMRNAPGRYYSPVDFSYHSSW